MVKCVMASSFVSFQDYIIFSEFHTMFFFFKLIIYNYFWNFMWLWVSCVPTWRHMDTTIIVFQICQFGIVIKVDCCLEIFYNFKTFLLKFMKVFNISKFWLILIESDHRVEYRSLQVFLDLMSLLQLCNLNLVTSM
jgi:hypothetical protein